MKLAPSEPWQKYDLPPPDTSRWVASRKMRVVLALNKKLVTIEYVINLYGMSNEELESWKTAVTTHGLNGLKTTKIQDGRKQ